MAGVYNPRSISVSDRRAGEFFRSFCRFCRIASGHCVENYADARTLILMRRDHQIVKVGIVPAFAEVLLQVLCPFRIDGPYALLNVCSFFETLSQATDALFIRGVDKRVKQ